MHDTEFDQSAPPSKTRRKRDMEELQQLGEALLDFKDEELSALEIPGNLIEAVRTARKIKAYGARRRQLQYIGKLMRNVDTTPIRTALETRRIQEDVHTKAFHRLEELREALISEGDASLARVLEQFPAADRQHLHKLARQARKERETHQPPRASRSLFRYLRELQEQSQTAGSS